MKHLLPLRVRLLLSLAAVAAGILAASPAIAAPPPVPTPPPAPTELYISEYIEGTSNNKAIEIYNGTGAAVNLGTGGYNIQMFFNGATSAGTTVNLTGTVAAGDVYVLAHASASATILAQADQTSSASWYNGDDAVVLRKGTTIIDAIGQVGFDPGTEWGTGLTSTADNTLRRKATVCGGDTNASDVFDPSVEWDGFATDTFSGLGSYVGCGSSAISGTGAANPSAVPQGGTTLLTVTVTPGSSPPSTGIQVTGDLTAIGGSATQSFFDDGTNGDQTSGDNVFSFQATVPVATTTGSKSIPFSISDAQLRSATGSISLSVVIPLAIHDIQGAGSSSPYVGSPVQTTGIVTGRKTNGFFIQAPDGFADADPATSEGIFVFTSSAPPAGAAVGNEVRVTGIVQEFIPSSDPFSPPTTEIGSPSVVVLSTGNPLPTAAVLTSALTDPSGPIDQLERFEGMRVSVASLTVIAPTQGSINEPNAASTSNGVFYGVITGIARPFREPGIEAPDPLPLPGIPRFDGNPERLRVDSDGIGAPILDVSTGAVVTNLVGPLDYAFRSYTIDIDPAIPAGVAPGISAAVPAPAPAADQFTVASFNLERFFDTANDPATSEPVLTLTAFNNRLNKASLAIRNVLRTPDILGVQEVENLATIQALAAKINTDAADPAVNYQGYLVEGNDIGGIDVGFLVNLARVNVLDVTQEGKDTTYINPSTGDPEILNDRPPLILRAAVKSPAGSVFPVTVIVNHLRSFTGVDDPVDGPRVRAKRQAQAEFLANLIQSRQTANPSERIVSVGDYNAYQFSDGYVDTIGTIIGDPDPCTEVVACSPDLVNPDLIEPANGVAPATERYSYVFDGNGQILDHILITQNLSLRFEGLTYVRNDADFPEIFRNDPNRPERISDHDPAVAYFRLPQISALSPADVWVGLRNSDDVGIRFDLRAEVYYNGTTLVGSGNLTSVVGGSSGFNNAKLDSIPLNLSSAVGLAPGDTISIKLLVRNACSGSGKNSGSARLWYNDAAANSHFDDTFDNGASANQYLLDGFALGTSPGAGPKKTIDVAAGAKCSDFKPFGTWTKTIN